MTNQEAFDQVVAHLRKQGRPAIANSCCRYRTFTGLTCAIGCLIPDAIYAETLEGNSIDSIICDMTDGTADAVRELFDAVDLELLDRLQAIHDDSENRLSQDAFDLAKVELGLRNTAATFGLRYTAPV